MTSLPLVPVPATALRPWLSVTLRGELQRSAAAVAGKGVAALHTRGDAAPSYPLLAFLKAAGIPWVIEGPNGEPRDGFAAPGPGTSPNEGYATEASPAVGLYGSVLHAAAADLRLGEFTSRMLAAAGCRPEYMGPTEPLRQPWDVGVLTAWLRQQMPLAIALVSGQGFAGALSAYRTAAGIVEAFDVLVSASHVGIERRAVEAAAVEANVQECGVDLHFGASGPHVPAGKDAFRVPQLLMLGPSLNRGIPVGSVTETVDAEVLGPAPFQHLAIRYPAVSRWDGGDTQALQQRVLAGSTDPRV
ncbi:DUF6177 family protein [Paenarthrobacter sp. NPDC092416]|uniref:DUF6177 family protein n=1 Tax=Paenarthrobacter sp. NPDC092416 TaxID=3364386 RepID=UPI00382F0C67